MCVCVCVCAYADCARADNLIGAPGAAAIGDALKVNRAIMNLDLSSELRRTHVLHVFHCFIVSYGWDRTGTN